METSEVTQQKQLYFLVKDIIIKTVYKDSQLKINLSSHLSAETGYNYTYLSNIFSRFENKSVQEFLISTKIERAKQLLDAGNTVGEVWATLNYSSVCHFSNQFKKITGMNPTAYILSKKSVTFQPENH